MSDEAKEIERLLVTVHAKIGLGSPASQSLMALAAIARRLLEERNEARRTDSPKADAPDEITNLRERIASLEREVASYEGMDRAVAHYQEEVRRLERELEEAKQYRDATQYPDLLVRTLRTNLDNLAVKYTALEQENESLRRFKASVDEALNSGDGSYRP